MNIRGYDQWKTASPYDDCDDEHCFNCGADLVQLDDSDGSDPMYNDYCCEPCPGVKIPCIRPMYELLAHDLGENAELWTKWIYKGTDCGAWLNIIECGSIQIGSIVEGSDQDCDTHTLSWPFTKKEFWGAVQSVEEQAEEIWNETHDEDGNEI